MKSNELFAQRAIVCLKDLLRTNSAKARANLLENANRYWDIMLGECDDLTCALLDIDTLLYDYDKLCDDVRKRRAALIVADVKRAIEMFRDLAKYNA